MRKLLPFFILSAIIIVFFRQFFLQNLLPIPSDTIVGLYNPFRDFYAIEYPRGIPFKNFLITDPVRQQYPWRLESIVQEKKWELPLWNPYNFAGNPLLGNLQSAGLMPFNFIFFLLPFATAWSVLIVLQSFLGGFFMFFYLRNRKLSVLPSLFGATVFIFSGFFISWLEWGTIDFVALWLPLILLSIDKAFVSKKKWLWYVLCLFSLCFAFLAGHAQTFLYEMFCATGYFLLRFFSEKGKIKHLFFAVGLLVVFFLITAIQWLPFAQFVLHSSRETDLVMSVGWFLPYQHLITFFVPDFFGNPTTLNYWGVWNYAELTGYVGIVGLFFVLYALFIKKEKTIWFFFGTCLIALFLALPTPFAYVPEILHIPFLVTLQPTRILFLIDFSLAILAAFGLHAFLENGKKVYIAVTFVSMVFGAIWFSVFLHSSLLPMVSLENIAVAKHNLVFPSIIFMLTVFLIVLGQCLRTKKQFLFIVVICLVVLAALDGIRFADKFNSFTKGTYLFPQTKTIQFLRSHAGISRIMTTDSQILPPNFSLVYHLQSVDGYDPLYIKEYGELIAAIERNKPDIHEPFGFNRIITPHNYQNQLINLLGVRYILSLTDLHDASLQKVFTEGQTRVYENKNVFPRAFFVQHIEQVVTSEESINFLFNSKDNLQTNAVVKGNFVHMDNLQKGNATITSYTDNEVVIQTKNSGDGFLVLSDSFYPAWHAYVDGKETKIYPTDLALRGVFVPKGIHVVKFTVHLF